jgi:uncharacterized membrane protein
VTFANPLPWWALALVVSGAAVLAWQTYRRFNAHPRQRTVLTLLRFVTLLVLVVVLMRPVVRSPAAAHDAVVAVLVDSSRSMGIQDAGQPRRIDRARQLVIERVLPVLEQRFRVDVLAFGDGVSPVEPQQLAATAHKSDLGGAISSLRERYRGQVVAGAVLLSDGGDTSASADRAAARAGVAVYPIGIGASSVPGDREVLSVTAADAVLDNSQLELAVSAVSHEPRGEPIELRLLANGRPIDVDRVMPSGPDAPVHRIFRVAPEQGAPTVYTVDIPAAPGDPVPENNVRSVLVQAPPRSRRILLVEGAPGFEHSFLKRTWTSDRGLEIDSVVRKGKNEQGIDTFYVQAARSRSNALASGYPGKTDDLFAYDAIVLANVDGGLLTSAQLQSTHDFVSRRGGGLLVLGARSFARQGLMDTALEDALPLELNARDGGVLPASNARGANRVSLTTDGAAHPIMQIADTADESRKRWDALPPLASVAGLGGPRAGATVLAVSGGAAGSPRALVAVQRYGEGRTMVFAGEAAWRWRMLMASNDRSYETFWRQAIRWLALPAPDPIAVTVPPGSAPGEPLELRVAVRNASFEPIRDAIVDLRIVGPSGALEQVRAAASGRGQGEGTFVTTYRPAQAGVYRVTAEARAGSRPLGSATTSMLVGGADLEMTDPRLNLQLLQRLAVASGGRVITEGETASLPDSLIGHLPAATLAVTRDLWHNGWSLAAIVCLLASEWIFRRRWGLR